MADRLVIIAISTFVFLGIVGLAQLFNPKADSMPPTNAFSKIIVNNNIIQADSYNDSFQIKTQGSISCTVSGNLMTCKIAQVSCPLLQAVKSVDANGNLVCGAL